MGGAEAGSSWMMLGPRARRDSTAGPLNDRGARPGAHLPILDRPGDLTKRVGGGGLCHAGWTDVPEKRQLHYRDPSVSLFSLQ